MKNIRYWAISRTPNGVLVTYVKGKKGVQFVELPSIEEVDSAKAKAESNSLSITLVSFDTGDRREELLDLVREYKTRTKSKLFLTFVPLAKVQPRTIMSLLRWKTHYYMEGNETP